MNCSARPGLDYSIGQLALFVILAECNVRELQIARSIFDQILRSVQADGRPRVTRLLLALGELSELDLPSLQREWLKEWAKIGI